MKSLILSSTLSPVRAEDCNQKFYPGWLLNWSLLPAVLAWSEYWEVEAPAMDPAGNRLFHSNQVGLLSDVHFKYKTLPMNF